MMIKDKQKSFINEDVKYFAKLFGRATFSFLKINLIGQFAIAILCVATLMLIIMQTYPSGGGPVHTSGEAAVVVLFMQRPIAFGLTVISILASPFLLFSMGNKYVMFKTINRLIADKGEKLLFPILDKILLKVKEHQPELFRQGVDKTKLQLRILQEIRDSKQNKWLKKIITFGFKKVDLNEIDFKDENVSFSEIIKIKIIDQLKSISEPSRLFFWVILGINALIFVLTALKVI
jgi:translation elongation factor EF-1beta